MGCSAKEGGTVEWKVTAKQTRMVTALAGGAVLQYPKKEKQGRSGYGNQVQPIVQ